MKTQFLIICILAMLLDGYAGHAQVQARHKPFSITFAGVTFTGTYSEGYLHRSVSGGFSAFWGLISWGGGETIECRPGSAICRIETIVSISAPKFRVDESGKNGFEKIEVKEGEYPVVVVAEEGKQISFAVDITQVPALKRSLYEQAIFELKDPFVLSPDIVRQLKLYDGPEEKGFIIPAGKYPLYSDGNIIYWTWERPEKEEQITDRSDR